MFVKLDDEKRIVMICDKYNESIGITIEHKDVTEEDLGKKLIDGVIQPREYSEEDIQNSLMILCDEKQNQVEKLILGYKATPMQLQRYVDKYNRAKAGEWDQATNEKIIVNHEAYLGKMRNLVDLIEHFRSKVDDLIVDGELDRARKIIVSAKSFDETTTLTDIQNLFNI